MSQLRLAYSRETPCQQANSYERSNESHEVSIWHRFDSQVRSIATRLHQLKRDDPLAGSAAETLISNLISDLSHQHRSSG